MNVQVQLPAMLLFVWRAVLAPLRPSTAVVLQYADGHLPVVHTRSVLGCCHQHVRSCIALLVAVDAHAGLSFRLVRMLAASQRSCFLIRTTHLMVYILSCATQHNQASIQGYISNPESDVSNRKNASSGRIAHPMLFNTLLQGPFVLSSRP
jgi:hypothetical protein